MSHTRMTVAFIAVAVVAFYLGVFGARAGLPVPVPGLATSSQYDTISGTVSAASPTSVTVALPDGTTATYSIDNSTQVLLVSPPVAIDPASLAPGAEVQVFAPHSGSGAAEMVQILPQSAPKAQ